MEFEQGRGSSGHLRTHFQVTYDEGQPFTGDTRSGSSSGSSSIKLDFIEKDALSSSLLKSEQTDLELQGPISSSGVSPCISIASSRSGSAIQAPPIQVMGKPGGYDPNRIPASVFSSRPATPVEWSIASNESLFSIYMGNSSFSRDHHILMPRSQELARLDDMSNFPASLLTKSQELTKLDEASNFPASQLTKSQELTKPDELSNFPASQLTKSQELTKPDELSNFRASLPPVTAAVEVEKMSVNILKGSEVEGMSPETPKMVLSGTTEFRVKEQLLPAEGTRISVNTAYSMDGSLNSTSSFAFAVLPSEGGRNSPVKFHSEKQQLRPQTSGSNASGTKWFSCCFGSPFCR